MKDFPAGFRWSIQGLVPPKKAVYRQTHRCIREGLARPPWEIAHHLYWHRILHRPRRSIGGAHANPAFFYAQALARYAKLCSGAKLPDKHIGVVQSSATQPSQFGSRSTK